METDDVTITKIELQKMLFFYTSIQNGWSIKKKGETYIFRKKHEGKQQIYDSNYLTTFIKQNSKNRIILE